MLAGAIGHPYGGLRCIIVKNDKSLGFINTQVRRQTLGGFARDARFAIDCAIAKSDL